MASRHFTIMVAIEEVIKTDDHSRGDGRRNVEEVVRVTAKAASLEEALHKTAAHLAAEHPEVKIFEDADNVPAGSRHLTPRPVRDNPQA